MTDAIEDIYRLSFAQQGLVFHSLADPASAFYVDQVLYTLRGRLDTDVFLRAWQTAADRHQALRTSFHWQGLDELTQVVHTQAELRMGQQDWRNVDGDEQQHRLEAFLQSDRRQPFDLERVPLIRLNLLRLGEEEWRFVFRYHHALLDAWSALRLLDEVFTSYNQLHRGESTATSAGRPYRDYVAWLRQQDSAAAESYWRDYLRGLRQPTPLPGAQGPGERPEAQPERENPERTVVIPVHATDGLRDLARRHKITVNTVMQGLWAMLLSQRSRESDVLFGTTISSRPPELPGLAETLGLFITTLPLRVRVEPGEAVLTCCRRLHHDQAERRRFDHSALADVQQCAETPAGVPLFNTIMTYLNVPGIASLRTRQSAEGELSVSGGEYRYRTNYPLSVMVIPGDEMTICAGYDPDRLSATTVDHLLRHLAALVTAVAADEAILIRDLPTAAPDELRVFADTKASVQPLECLHTVLTRRLNARPDAVALVTTGGALTSAQLDQRANQLAHHLRNLGVGPNVRVGLCLERGAEIVIAILAVLKAGGSYVPLDPAYPAARLEYMVRNAGVTVLVTQQPLRDVLPRGETRTVLVDAHRRTIARASTEAPTVSVGPKDAAYIMYTSGSTGDPKGVVVTHGGLSALAVAQQNAFALGPDDDVLQWASPSFDASVFEIVMALHAGARLHVAAREDLVPGPALARLLAERRITTLTIPPSALAALPVVDLPRLTTLVAAGEALQPDLIRRWAPGRRMFNAYGPTEATVWVTLHEVDADSAEDEVPPPIGTPLAHVVVRLLDRYLRLVPPGVVGELYVGGAGVARGYLGRPALTAERFVPDPFGPPGSLLYRSGDLARWHDDGSVLDFIGREDDQVKLRGLRIETGEIEAAMLRNSSVADAAVQLRRDDPSDPLSDGHLIAYWAPVDHVATDVDLRARLAEVLPDHLVPARCIAVREIPLTPNGKRDLVALEAAERAGDHVAAGERFIGPRSSTERLVADVWVEVLGVNTVGVTDDFFVLGGNSIKGTQIVARLSRTCGTELSLRTLLTCRTVEKLASEVEQALPDRASSVKDRPA